MSKPVRQGGTVCGPAPQKENISVSELPVRQLKGDDVAGNAPVPDSPDPPEMSLSAAHAALARALKSQRGLEARLEKVCCSLLIAGEQIPTFDQPNLSMLQEAYINASAACSVACEKAMICQHRVHTLSQSSRPDEADSDEWLIAA